MPVRRRSLTSALVASLALGLSGCGGGADAASNATRDSSSVATTTTHELRAWQLAPRAFPVKVQQQVPGLVTHAQESMKPPLLLAAWPELESSEEFSSLLRNSTQGAIDDFTSDVPGEGENLRPSFGQVWALTQATPSVLAVTLDRHTFAGASGGRSFVSYVLDRKADTASTGASLVQPEQQRNVAQVVAQAITAAGQTPLSTESASDDDITALVDTATIGLDGELVLVASSGSLLPTSAGSWAVAIPAAQARPYLTDLGRQAQQERIEARSPGASAPTLSASAPADPADSTEDPAAAAQQPGAATATGGGATATAASPASDVDCAVKRCVALTFDDGPGPYTDELLGYLKAADVHATFFTVGRSVSAMPDVVRRQAAEGHEVAVHTWSHPDLTRLQPEQATEEIEKSVQVVKTVTGVEPTLLRPPYGAFIKGKTPSDGRAVIQWDVDTEDWKNRSTPITTQRALDGAHPGAIILLHDIHPTSVKAVPGIIAGLKAKGYTLVTVSQLLGDPRPGVVYFSR